MPRTRMALIVATPLALALTACGGGTPDSAEPAAPATADALDDASADELYEQAQEEGSVVVYSFTSRIAEVETAFEAAYPGVDLIGNDISATEQIARIKAEAQAGTPGADVAYLSDAPVVLTELVEAGLLHGYVPPRLDDTVPDRYREPLLAQRLSTKVLMYNEDAHPDGPPVGNLWELTQPEWTGRVVMVDPAVRGDYLDLATELTLRSDDMAAAYQELTGTELELDDGVPDAGSQWLKDLYENDVVLVDDTDNVNAAVGQIGQDAPPVGFTSYSDRRDNADEGWALQVATDVAPANGIAFPALLGIVDGAEHPAAARLLIDFLMGDDTETGGAGFEPFYVAGDYPVRTDVVPPADAVALDDLGAWIIDPAAVAERRAEVADFLLTLG
ncbi:ABC transporter substrate-binding protein [Jiangella muralis]|uniref:ABC transporter substrate-binding protein n=1 Tax=Jiangella muralis TaxID=702383 RepID=UPI00069F419E|nr:ABC transporter substrate-binding protein [Jiangella muralis]